MLILAKRLGVISGIIMIAWGIYLIIDTELKAASLGNSVPGIFGAHAGKVGGIILIVGGILGFFGGLLVTKFSFFSSCILMLVCLLSLLTILPAFLSPWMVLSLLLTITFFVSSLLAIKAWARN